MLRVNHKQCHEISLCATYAEEEYLGGMLWIRSELRTEQREWSDRSTTDWWPSGFLTRPLWVTPTTPASSSINVTNGSLGRVWILISPLQSWIHSIHSHPGESEGGGEDQNPLTGWRWNWRTSDFNPIVLGDKFCFSCAPHVCRSVSFSSSPSALLGLQMCSVNGDVRANKVNSCVVSWMRH